MGTKERRARSKENLREEILEAARALFVKEGYDNVSIRKIADKIEYAPGTIYLYFEDKADILRTICDETFVKLHRRLKAIAEDSGPPLDKLRRAERSYIQFALDNSAQYTLVFMTRFDESTALKPGPSDVGFLCFQDLCNIVQQCIDDDLLRSKDANETSQAIWAGVHGVSSLLIAKCGFPFVEQSRLIDRVIDITIEGVRKPG
ncbi:MAG: TetR/AcrR family transcriptional regulator [Acidobacteriaceae bacterium]|nr:TetR/AcrR family transcriptional regulator [Acidobacteriaceae bacterium]